LAHSQVKRRENFLKGLLRNQFPARVKMGLGAIYKFDFNNQQLACCGGGGAGKWSCKQSARMPLLFLPSRNPSCQQPERELGS
jgi:hypothetical protein